MMCMLTTPEQLAALTSMDLLMEPSQVLFHSDGMFKHAMICQLNSEMNQQQVALAGKLLIDMDGPKTVKQDSISIHNMIGLSIISVEEILEQTLKGHQILFFQTETLIHGVVVVFLQMLLQTILPSS